MYRCALSRPLHLIYLLSASPLESSSPISVSEGGLLCDMVLFDWSSQVDISLQSSFQPGMKLEVANKSSPDTYWVATIVTTCGQLLLLRFSGYGDDRKADFWCDVMTAELHPVGWCSQNNKTLQPPEGRGTTWEHARTHIHTRGCELIFYHTHFYICVLHLNTHILAYSE